MKVVRIQTTHMLAVSNVEMYGKNASGAALGRQGGFLDDEDVEE